MATDIGIRELLEAGVHFGHQTRRWNPKMRRYIFGERGGIHIIDLKKTERLLEERAGVRRGPRGPRRHVLFVGTKKQARDAIEEAATVRDAVRRPALARRPADELPDHQQAHPAPARARRDWTERARWSCCRPRAHRRDETSATSSRPTSAAWRTCSARPTRSSSWTSRPRRSACARPSGCKIPIIGLVDTNCDPDPVDYVIPGNDDAIRSCKVIIEAIAESRAKRAALPRRGGGRPARARGAGAQRGRGEAPRARPRSRSAARPRSAPAARPRRPASRPTSPPRRRHAAGDRERAPARRASAAPSTLTRSPDGIPIPPRT